MKAHMYRKDETQVRLGGPLRERQGGRLMDACEWAYKTQVNWWPVSSA